MLKDCSAKLLVFFFSVTFAAHTHLISMFAAQRLRMINFTMTFLIGCYLNYYEVGGTVTRHHLGRSEAFRLLLLFCLGRGRVN